MGQHFSTWPPVVCRVHEQKIKPTTVIRECVPRYLVEFWDIKAPRSVNLITGDAGDAEKTKVRLENIHGQIYVVGEAWKKFCVKNNLARLHRYVIVIQQSGELRVHAFNKGNEVVELKALTRKEVTTAELLEQVVTEAGTTEQTQSCVEPVNDAGRKEETPVLAAPQLPSAALEADGVATGEPSNVAEPSTVQAQACKVDFGTHQLDENMKDRVRVLAGDPQAIAVFIAKMNATSIKHSEMYFPVAVSKKLVRGRKVPFNLQMLQQEAHDTTLIASSFCKWRVSRNGKNVLLKEKTWCKIVGIAALKIGDVCAFQILKKASNIMELVVLRLQQAAN